MGELCGLISSILGILKPHISPSEYEKWDKQFWDLKEKNDERRKKIKEALLNSDISALNIILSDLLEL
jgi:hypothetical protein